MLGKAVTADLDCAGRQCGITVTRRKGRKGGGFKRAYNRLATCLQLPCNQPGTSQGLAWRYGAATVAAPGFDSLIRLLHSFPFLLDSPEGGLFGQDDQGEQGVAD